MDLVPLKKKPIWIWMGDRYRSLAFFLFCFLGVMSLPISLYAQNNSELDNIKKIHLSINNDNILAFQFQDFSTEVVPPRTYKKMISTPNETLMVSYGSNIESKPTLCIQLRSTRSPEVLIAFSKQTISMTLGSSITITFGETSAQTTISASLNGIVKLGQKQLSPGIEVPLLIEKEGLVPAKKEATTPPKEPLNDPLPSIPQYPDLTKPRSPPSAKSIERRKIMLQALEEVSKNIAPPENPSLTTSSTKNDSVTSKITVQRNPDNKEALIRENQILLQISTGLQNILDQITNNPLSADDTFNLGLPPLPPAASKPETMTFTQWIAKLQSDNNAFRQKVVQTRDQLTQFLNSLTKPSYRLSPMIPESVEEETRLASSAYKQQDWNNAALHYQKALKIEPASLHVLSNLGVVYFSQGNYEEAEKILLQTVRQAPHDSFSYSILGICYLQKEQIEKALDALFLSVNMNPLDAQSQNYLAMTLTKKGWLKAAEEHARESVRLNPNYSEAHYNLAQIYANQNPIARELAKKHYHLSTNLGGARDEALEKILQIEPPKPSPNEPLIQVNPATP